MNEEHKVRESTVNKEKSSERPQVESSKVHIKSDSKSSKASVSLKKPSKFVKHSYENGEFVKKRVEAEEGKMENKGDQGLSWTDNNKIATLKCGEDATQGRMKTKVIFEEPRPPYY
ncbi:hypothetical protein E3N88_45806 [Mikania micrantha]|uniref:Uncharacterized protein n=1 Tax=Mikania micrantha TaxID=192012 RepID=A0A5N6L8E0_9ASTR|nr:hypothetical protein E3N88_45806 [Mikania micrantha]